MSEIIKKRQKEILDKIRSKIPNISVKETIKPTKSFILDLRCSSTGEGFRVFLLREHQNGLYKVVQILKNKLDIQSNSYKSGRLYESDLKNTLEIHIDEIERDKIKCPWCEGSNGKWEFIQCGCGKLSCSGGIKEYGGKSLFKCPWCGSEAYIEGYIQKVRGKRVGKDKITKGTDRKKLDSSMKKKYPALIEK